MASTTHQKSPSSLKKIWLLLKQTVSEWSDDKAPRLGAALAYYTVFSIAPLLIIGIMIAGLVFDNAESQIMTQVQGLLGDKGSEAIGSMIEAAQKPVQSTVATVLALATLFFGAAGVFVQLKEALNTVWDVPPAKSGGIFAFLRRYFLSFTMVLGIGFLLLVSLLLEAALTIVGQLLEDRFPALEVVMPVMGFAVSFVVVTFLFAMLFKFLPDVQVPWRDVWIGAVLTACLFVMGKIVLGVYLGKAGTASAYGAAGSLVLVLLWVYYSAQILFFGAEFTQVYSQRHGSRRKPQQLPVKNRKDREELRKEQLIAKIERDRNELAAKLKVFGAVEPERIPHVPRWRKKEL